MAAVATMLTTTARAAFKARAGAAAAVETRTPFAAAAIFHRASVGRTAAAARFGAAVFAAAAIVVARIVASIATAITTGSAIASPAASAEGALETGAGIAAANACGVARKIFARRASGARCARFAGKKNAVFFDVDSNFRDGKVADVGGSGIGFERGDMLRFGVGFFVCRFGFSVRLFVRGVCFRLGTLGSGAGSVSYTHLFGSILISATSLRWSAPITLAG